MKKKFILTINHYCALIIFDKFDNHREGIKKVANSIVQKLNLRVVKKIIYSFKPVGETLVFILSKSHLAIHTWPESKILHIDLVSCADLTREEFEKTLRNVFQKNKNCEITIKRCNF